MTTVLGRLIMLPAILLTAIVVATIATFIYVVSSHAYFEGAIIFMALSVLAKLVGTLAS